MRSLSRVYCLKSRTGKEIKNKRRHSEKKKSLWLHAHEGVMQPDSAEAQLARSYTYTEYLKHIYELRP